MRNPGKPLQFFAWLVLLLGISTQIAAQQQRVEVQLSSHRVSIDESVILSVRAYSLDAELDVSALGAEFDVTKRSSSRQVTIENGKRTSVVEWILELIPRRTGVIEVPPVKVGSEQSRPMTLLVEQPASGTARDLYIEASVDVSDPYVQAQVIYTLRVFQDVRFLDASLSLPDVEGALMQQLGDERSYQQNVNGRNYTVSEIRYSVFPQQSGELTIPSIILKAVVPVDRNQVPNTRTRTRSLTRRAQNITLNVRPRPDGLEGSWWLPAKDIQLQSEWSEPIDALSVDQPVTRTIHVMAHGVADSQLPALDVPQVDNISIYADTPTAATNASEKGMLSQQTNTWAVIAQVPGKLVLPEVRVNWFDTKTGEARVATLPAETLVVNAPDGANQNMLNNNSASSNTSNTNGGGVIDQATASGQQNDSGLNANDTDALVEQSEPNGSEQNGVSENALSNASTAIVVSDGNTWRNIAFGLLVGWILSLAGIWFWWRKRFGKTKQAKPVAITESTIDRFRRRAGSRAALEPIKSACQEGDVSKISQQVLAWGAMVWPESPPTHISDVAKRLNHQPLSDLFNDLDALQYRSAGGVKPVAVESIPDMLKTAVDQYQEQQDKSTEANALPAL